jgi:hypothetical protein
MRPHAVETILLASSLFGSSTGCSYALVQGPPSPVERGERSNPEATPGSCTSSDALPTLDTIASVPFIGIGALGLVALFETESCPSGQVCLKSPGAYAAIAAGGFALGGLLIASAATGYGRTSDCRRWQQTLPGPPHPSARYLLDLGALAHARSGTAPGP